MAKQDIELRKVLAIVLMTIGLHGSTVLGNPEQWKLLLGVLIGNICINLGQYLWNPKRDLSFPTSTTQPARKA
jgi:hypothetical protein